MTYLNVYIDVYIWDNSGLFFLIVAYYKENIAVFTMPGLGNFIQDFDKNYPLNTVNLDTFSPHVKLEKNTL